MKLVALFILLISSSAFAEGFTCTHIQGKSRTDVTLFDGKYIVRYSWTGRPFPTEDFFQGEATAEIIHDSITLYTLHDFIRKGEEAKFTHYGVVADFGELRMNCREL